MFVLRANPLGQIHSAPLRTFLAAANGLFTAGKLDYATLVPSNLLVARPAIKIKCRRRRRRQLRRSQLATQSLDEILQPLARRLLGRPAPANLSNTLAQGSARRPVGQPAGLRIRAALCYATSPLPPASLQWRRSALISGPFVWPSRSSISNFKPFARTPAPERLSSVYLAPNCLKSGSQRQCRPIRPTGGRRCGRAQVSSRLGGGGSNDDDDHGCGEGCAGRGG